MTISICPLTGYSLQGAQFGPQMDATVTYTFKPTGKVRIALSTYIAFTNSGNNQRPELAGICRNAYEKGEEPPMIDDTFLFSGIRNLDYPKSFVEKARHLLRFLYDHGGKDFKDFDLQPGIDYPLAYAVDPAEFKKLIIYLREKFWITIRNEQLLSSDRVIYRGINMTDEGISEAEKTLHQIPMIGLVNQQISTGNSAIDEKINHARKLFFDQPRNMQNMRSACETLSMVLEPLRGECERIFTRQDTSSFFRIVNEFDIHHNNHRTASIEHPEQLEWIFYTLLNTISTYYKLKAKLSL